MNAPLMDRTTESMLRESSHLRRCARDLVALSALPALWAGRDAHHVAESLADVLLTMLCADLVYIRLAGLREGIVIEAARAAGQPRIGSRAPEIGSALAGWLQLGGAGPAPAIPNPLGRGTLRLAVTPIRFQEEWGVAAVGAAHGDFPTEVDRLVLSLASNQAAVALQNARTEARYRDLSDELEQRVRERTAELTSTVQALDAEVAEREQAERSSRAQTRALTRVLEQLTREPRFDRSPGIVLAAIVEQFEASGGALWIYNEMAGCFERILDCEEGRILLADDPDVAFPQQRVDSRKLLDWERFKAAFLRDECIVMTDLENLPALDPDTRATYVARGIRTVLVVPMLLQGRLLGCCTLRSTRSETYGPRDFALAQALARQATLAIQLTRLAEQARQTAVLEERERAAQERAAERARENQALRQTLDALAGKPELDQFLGTVIAAITEQLGAVSSSLWLFDWDAHTSSLALIYQGGRVMRACESGHPQPVLDLTSIPEWVSLLREGRAVIHNLDGISSPLSASRDYLFAQDVKKAVLVPLTLGDNIIGAFSTRFRAEMPIAPEKVDLAHALAHQATLAIQMARLAEQARQTAVLEERERAAQERAAELARENQALLQTLDALAGKPELEQFLGTVIAAITEQLGAVSSSLWLFDWDAHTMSLALVYQDGRVVPAAESGHPQPVIELANYPEFAGLFQGRSTVTYEMAALSPSLSATRDHLVTQGVSRTVAVPLALGESVIGTFSTRFSTETPIAPEKIELAHALAHQATLAIQMARLAEQARQTAVLEERTRMAGEIHDGLGQAFTGILLHLGALELLPAGGSAQERALLDRVRELARDGLAEARRSAYALRPQVLEETDLAGALERMIAQLNTAPTTRITFRRDGTPHPLPPDVADHLLRIGQEALTNAVRHAQASEIAVELSFTEQALRLCVSDDGRGFARESPQPQAGFGLNGLRGRAGLIGAQLSVDSRPGSGTRVELSWRFPPG